MLFFSTPAMRRTITCVSRRSVCVNTVRMSPSPSRVAKSMLRIKRVIKRAASRLVHVSVLVNEKRATDNGRLRSVDSATTFFKSRRNDARVRRPVSGSKIPSVSSALSIRLRRPSKARIRTRGIITGLNRIYHAESFSKPASGFDL